ncbi:MAG: tyrosinase family protein [Candidatus Solibacter sp.]
MNVEIQINNSLKPAARYVTWAWSPCLARISNPALIIGTQVAITLNQAALGGGGQIRFSKTASGAGAATLSLTLPKNGASVPFFVRGTVASTADPGLQINAHPASSRLVLGSAALMVRIRKSVTSLTTPERDRLIAALATLNNQGLGRYADFAGTHVQAATPEAHGRPGFLPWHRAFVLDLERELQAIDSSVAIPYWRFDQPAAALFTPDFLGRGVFQGPGTNAVVFSATNPLRFWKAGPTPGIFRDPFFNVNAASPGPMGQAAALALGNPGALFKNFRRLESIAPQDYHGQAHVSFSGPIDSIPTAAQDPLFFLLHCNVDHAWALWQKQNARLDPATAASFETVTPPNRIGHNLGDTMWPWNGDLNPPRPNFALGGTMAPSACVGAPGLKPKVQDVFDYQGSVSLVNNLGFSYDDVPL